MVFYYSQGVHSYIVLYVGKKRIVLKVLKVTSFNFECL